MSNSDKIDQLGEEVDAAKAAQTSQAFLEQAVELMSDIPERNPVVSASDKVTKAREHYATLQGSMKTFTDETNAKCAAIDNLPGQIAYAREMLEIYVRMYASLKSAAVQVLHEIYRALPEKHSDRNKIQQFLADNNEPASSETAKLGVRAVRGYNS